MSARGCSSATSFPTGISSQSKRPCGRRARRALLRAQREGVLVGASNAVLAREVLRGLRHRIHAVGRRHRRIDEAPAERGVLELLFAAERRVGLAHHVGRARHAFDAAGDDQLGVAQGDRTRGLRRPLPARTRTGG